MKSEHKGFSLRRRLMSIVVGCWLLPMALTLAPLAYYTAINVRRQFDENVRASISNAADNCRRSMSAAVDASRNASYSGAVRSAYVLYQKIQNRQLLYESISMFLNQNYRYDDHFLTTMIFLTEEPSDIYYTYNPMLNASYTAVLEYRSDVHDEAMRVLESLDTNIAFLNVNGNVYMARNIVDSSFKPYAAIVSQLNPDAVFGSFRNIMWETGVSVSLNGVAVNVLPGGKEIPAQPAGGMRLSMGEQKTNEDGDFIYVYGRENTGAVDIRYVVEIDQGGFLRGFFNFFNTVAALLFLTVPMLCFAIWFFYRNIFDPIGRLISAAKEIQDGRLGYEVDSKVTNREFKYLNTAFNSMSVRLKRQFERIYTEEVALRDARIMALQSQINPHFLNNTLEIINWEVRLRNNAKVSKMLEALAVMLDAAMDRKSSPLVTLAQEMMYVDAYLYIIMERFGKRLEVVKNIDPSLFSHTLPRLIMQPIIENAVEHGIAKRQSGKIEIIAEEAESGMILGIKNDSPMSDKDLRTATELLSPSHDVKKDGSLHLGIYNVNLRLKMIYGEASCLSITSSENSTLASFYIPFDEGDTQVQGEH